MKINKENWNYTQLSMGNLKAFISLGGNLVDEQVVVEYYVTLADSEDKEIFQQEYSQLEMALETINSRYSDWTPIIVGEKLASESGCSSCAAH